MLERRPEAEQAVCQSGNQLVKFGETSQVSLEN